MTTASLQRARQLLADPRDPQQWLTQPGQATALLAVLRAVTDDLEELLSASALQTDTMLRGNDTLRALTNTVKEQTNELNQLASAAAKVLQLHQDSADHTCSSCRIPHPCHTRKAILAGVSA